MQPIYSSFPKWFIANCLLALWPSERDLLCRNMTTGIALQINSAESCAPFVWAKSLKTTITVTSKSSSGTTPEIMRNVAPSPAYGLESSQRQQQRPAPLNSVEAQSTVTDDSAVKAKQRAGWERLADKEGKRRPWTGGWRRFPARSNSAGAAWALEG